MDKTKIKHGIAHIAQSSVTFFVQTFGRLFGIVLFFAGIILLFGLIGSNAQWLDRRLQLLAAAGIAVVASISFTQWLLLALLLIVWNNNIVDRRILDTLKNIEAAVVGEHPEPD